MPADYQRLHVLREVRAAKSKKPFSSLEDINEIIVGTHFSDKRFWHQIFFPKMKGWFEDCQLLIPPSC